MPSATKNHQVKLDPKYHGYGYQKKLHLYISRAQNFFPSSDSGATVIIKVLVPVLLILLLP
jgi:hypothetical protein